MTNIPGDTFVVDLAATFLQLENDDAVILEYNGCAVIQFILDIPPVVDRAALHVQAFADRFLPDDRRYGAAGAARLTALGWQAPNPPREENWTTKLAWPCSGSGARSVAQLVVDTLRDVFGVTTLAGLAYQAFNVASHVDLNLPVLAPFPRLPRTHSN